MMIAQCAGELFILPSPAIERKPDDELVPGNVPFGEFDDFLKPYHRTHRSGTAGAPVLIVRHYDDAIDDCRYGGIIVRVPDRFTACGQGHAEDFSGREAFPYISKESEEIPCVVGGHALEIDLHSIIAGRGADDIVNKAFPVGKFRIETKCVRAGLESSVMTMCTLDRARRPPDREGGAGGIDSRPFEETGMLK